MRKMIRKIIGVFILSLVAAGCEGADKRRESGRGQISAVKCVELVAKRLGEANIYFNLPFRRAIASEGRPIALVASVELAASLGENSVIKLSAVAWTAEEVVAKSRYHLILGDQRIAPITIVSPKPASYISESRHVFEINEEALRQVDRIFGSSAEFVWILSRDRALKMA
jgi:hypothetical protein